VGQEKGMLARQPRDTRTKHRGQKKGRDMKTGTITTKEEWCWSHNRHKEKQQWDRQWEDWRPQDETS